MLYHDIVHDSLKSCLFLHVLCGCCVNVCADRKSTVTMGVWFSDEKDFPELRTVLERSVVIHFYLFVSL